MDASTRTLAKKFVIHWVKTMLMLAVVFAVTLGTEEAGRAPWMRAVLLAAVIAISVYFLWGSIRIIAGVRSDELADRIWTRGGLYAHSASIILASVYGVLETTADLPRLRMSWVALGMIAIGLLSTALVQRRYQ